MKEVESKIEALDRLKAKLQCMKLDVSGRAELCNGDCDACDLNYAQGNFGEQIAALEIAIDALERLVE